MGTPNKLSAQIDETGGLVVPSVIVDPLDPTKQMAVNSDGSLNFGVGASRVSYSNPQIIQDQVRAATLQGKHFHATTNLLTSGTANFRGAQLFNPLASGVILYVYSALVIFNSANFHDLRFIAANATTITGWTNVAMAAVNMDGGNVGASAAVASYTSTDITSGNLIGTAFESIGTQNNVPVEAFTNGEFIRLTSGNGIIFYLRQGAANSWGSTWGWMEY